MKWTAAIAAGALTAGVIFGWLVRGKPEIIHQRVEVPVGSILELEPRFDLGWMKDPLQKLVRASLEAQQRATARGGARTEVIEFCRPLVEAHARPEAPDTIAIPVIAAEDARAVLLSYRISDPWNPWAPKRIDHFAASNRGDRLHDVFYGRGQIEGGVLGDSTVATGSRFGWVQPTVTHGGAFGLGFAAALAVCSLRR